MTPRKGTMPSPNTLQPFRLPLTISETHIDVAGMYRDGTGTPADQEAPTPR
jgi:hypothetical protein